MMTGVIHGVGNDDGCHTWSRKCLHFRCIRVHLRFIVFKLSFHNVLIANNIKSCCNLYFINRKFREYVKNFSVILNGGVLLGNLGNLKKKKYPICHTYKVKYYNLLWMIIICKFKYLLLNLKSILINMNITENCSVCVVREK